MANFFFSSGEAGISGINMDQVRFVTSNKESGVITIYFDQRHTLELTDESAKEFLDVLTRLKSEASVAVEIMKREKAAKNSPDKPKPPSGGSRSSKPGPWS